MPPTSKPLCNLSRLLAVLGSLSGFGCAGGNDPGAGEVSGRSFVEYPEAIAGGQIDEMNSAVFGMWIRRGPSAGLCSATLIAPNLMLTARHCVSPSADPERGVNCLTDEFSAAVSPDMMKFSNAVQPRWNDLWYSAKRVLVNDASGSSCGSDIALVVLTEPVPASVARPVVPRLNGVDIGEAYTAVGYGLDSTEAAVARAGTRHVLSGLSVVCTGTSCGNGTAPSEFQGTAGVCSGDSGGPALDANGKVLGLLSRGPDPCDDPVYTAVFAFRDLLLSAAQDAAREEGGILPEWAGGQPAPVSPASGSANGTEPLPSASAAATGSVEPEQEGNSGALRAEASCAVNPGGIPLGTSPRGQNGISLLLVALGLVRFRMCVRGKRE